MTLNLLLARQPRERETLILADPYAPAASSGAWPSPANGSVEPLVSGLVSQLSASQRVVFPLPHETARRYVPQPSLMRSRHADLWHALTAQEHARALLVAGPTAAYLAPVVGGEPITLVAVPDPSEVAAPARGGWRFVLGPFPDLDDVPEEDASEDDLWLDRIRAATSQLELVRATDLEAITTEVAVGIGLGPKQAARAAAVASTAGKDRYRSRRRDTPAHRLDQLLYSLTRPPA
jgi:hypothetical protein